DGLPSLSDVHTPQNDPRRELYAPQLLAFRRNRVRSTPNHSVAESGVTHSSKESELFSSVYVLPRHNSSRANRDRVMRGDFQVTSTAERTESSESSQSSAVMSSTVVSSAIGA